MKRIKLNHDVLDIERRRGMSKDLPDKKNWVRFRHSRRSEFLKDVLYRNHFYITEHKLHGQDAVI